MDPHSLHKQKPSQKTQLKLPYLEKDTKPKPKPSTRNLLLPQQPKDFNLSTSNSKLPHYNPQNDSNLKFFFQKPTNKKILDKLKQNQLSKKSQYIHDSLSQHKQSSTRLTPINQTRLIRQAQEKDGINKKNQSIPLKKNSTVTSHQFLNYLQNVRKRILSTGTHTQLQHPSSAVF